MHLDDGLGLPWMPVDALLYASGLTSDVATAVKTSFKDGIPGYEAKTISGLLYVRAVSGHSDFKWLQRRNTKIHTRRALSGEDDIGTLILDSTSSCMTLRSLVAEAAFSTGG